MEFCSVQFADRYRDMIDMILCEVTPIHREECFKYYKGRGRLFMQLYTKEYIKYIDQFLLTAAKMAVLMYKNEQMRRWGHVRKSMKTSGIVFPNTTTLKQYSRTG